MKFTPYASSSAGNLYSLSDGETDILIECGVTYRKMQQLLPKSPSEYAACVYTHSHGDHYNRLTEMELRRRGKLVLGGEGFVPGMGNRVVNTIAIRSFDVQHDVPAYGFLLRSIRNGETCIFLIDTFYCPVTPSFSPTIVAIECNYARDLMKPGDDLNDRLFGSHMELGQCIETLLAWDLSRTREIHLLHLSDSRSDEARFIREVQAATGVPTYAAPKFRDRKNNQKEGT